MACAPAQTAAHGGASGARVACAHRERASSARRHRSGVAAWNIARETPYKRHQTTTIS